LILKYPSAYTLTEQSNSGITRTSSTPAGLGVTIDVFTCTSASTTGTLTFTF
jgi:hypothetical protein